MCVAEWESDLVVPLIVDVTNPESVARAVAQAPDTTIVINNAGIPLREPIATLDEGTLRRAFEINFFGPLNITQQFAPVIAGNGGGAVVNILSVLCWVAVAPGYSAAKAALWQATNAFRVELAPQNIQVVAVHMGYVDTPMTANLDVAKISAESVATSTFDALADGEYEVLVDDTARTVRGALSGPLAGMYPQLQVHV
ncbi:SDR family oxidoreductase [Leifsonia kafniensis]|uniref:SDR family oxidoreductase n=1 Tax=Leifsonia kafniensis TaxID=475957 RepID=A0ABP7KA92_9MICO